MLIVPLWRRLGLIVNDLVVSISIPSKSRPPLFLWKHQRWMRKRWHDQSIMCRVSIVIDVINGSIDAVAVVFLADVVCRCLKNPLHGEYCFPKESRRLFLLKLKLLPLLLVL